MIWAFLWRDLERCRHVFCMGVKVIDIENRTFCLKDNIIFALFKDGGVIFNLKDRVSHSVNRSGVSILEMMDCKIGLKGMINNFCHEYKLTESTARDDIMLFLTRLEERGWLDVR